MSFNKFIQVSEQAPMADTSALAAINRALRSVAGLFLESSSSAVAAIMNVNKINGICSTPHPERHKCRNYALAFASLGQGGFIVLLLML
jgi:hypothetical protein